MMQTLLEKRVNGLAQRQCWDLNSNFWPLGHIKKYHNELINESFNESLNQSILFCVIVKETSQSVMKLQVEVIYIDIVVIYSAQINSEYAVYKCLL